MERDIIGTSKCVQTVNTNNHMGRNQDLESASAGRQSDSDGVEAILIRWAMKTRIRFSLLEKQSCTTELGFDILGYLG